MAKSGSSMRKERPMRTGRAFVGAAAAFGALLCCAETFAEEDRADQIMAMARARARAEITLRKMRPVMNRGENGWNESSRKLNNAVARIRSVLNNARLEEQAKQEMKDQEFINDCTQKRKTVDTEWTEFGRTKTKLDGRLRTMETHYRGLQTAFGQIPSPANYFKNAGADLSAFARLYGVIAGRAEEVKDAVEQTVNALSENLDEWEGKLADAEEFTGVGGARGEEGEEGEID